MMGYEKLWKKAICNYSHAHINGFRTKEKYSEPFPVTHGDYATIISSRSKEHNLSAFILFSNLLIDYN